MGDGGLAVEVMSSSWMRAFGFPVGGEGAGALSSWNCRSGVRSTSRTQAHVSITYPCKTTGRLAFGGSLLRRALSSNVPLRTWHIVRYARASRLKPPLPLNSHHWSPSNAPMPRSPRRIMEDIEGEKKAVAAYVAATSGMQVGLDASCVEYRRFRRPPWRQPSMLCCVAGSVWVATSGIPSGAILACGPQDKPPPPSPHLLRFPARSARSTKAPCPPRPPCRPLWLTACSSGRRRTAPAPGVPA